jgi:hypothetical protein
MGYKTFKDMKQNIPEGATHYQNESEEYMFAWFDYNKDKCYVMGGWKECTMKDYPSGEIKPIPTTIKTESPEEREALDMIGTTSKQVESLSNDSELPNSSEWDGEGLPPVGVECCFTPDNNLWGFASTDTYSGEVLRYEGEQFVFLLSHDKYNIRPCHLIVSRTDKGEFSKPESPEQKAERERLESAYDLCTTVYPDFSGFDEFKKSTTTVNLWLAIVDKTGYRKVNQ